MGQKEEYKLEDFSSRMLFRFLDFYISDKPKNTDMMVKNKRHQLENMSLSDLMYAKEIKTKSLENLYKIKFFNQDKKEPKLSLPQGETLDSLIKKCSNKLENIQGRIDEIMSMI